MKKIIILTSILLLAGLGCSKAVDESPAPKPKLTAPKTQITETPKQVIIPLEEPFESNLSDEKITELNQLFASKNEESGLKTHYPTYIPEGIELNKESVLVSQTQTIGNILTYNIGGEPDSDLPWIMAQEQKEDPNNSKHVLEPNETAIPSINGYGFTSQNEVGTFNHVVFTTKNGTFIKLTSKHFDLVTLSKMARSMK